MVVAGRVVVMGLSWWWWWCCAALGGLVVVVAAAAGLGSYVPWRQGDRRKNGLWLLYFPL